MSVQSIQSSHAVAQNEAVSQAQSAQRQANLHSTLPQDKVTISAAAQAKQTASSIGGDVDHDGDSK